MNNSKQPLVITATQTIEAAPDVIWSRIVDWDRMNQWGKDVRGVKVASEKREGIGAEVHVRVRMGLVTGLDILRVTRWEPPLLLETEHLGRIRGRAVMSLEPLNSETRVSWEERLMHPAPAIGSLFLRLSRPTIKRTMVRDLRALKELVEGGGSQ